MGVLTLDFSVQGDEWVADRVSCRVHASGNWTLEGAVTSHYQNHLRAVAGLPLGSTRCLEPCATVALVGQQPALEGVLATPGARVHLHGRAPGAGGELGHVTISAPTPVELLRGLETLVRRLDDAELSAVLERLL